MALDWDNTPTATGYEVFQRPQAGGTYPATPPATVRASEHTVTGLTEGVGVCFRVQAVNADGPGLGLGREVRHADRPAARVAPGR